MKYEELIEKLDSISWFSNVGGFNAIGGQISIPSLEAWGGGANSQIAVGMSHVIDSMEWLPTSNDQEDPIFGNMLKNSFPSVVGGKELNMAAYKLALKSLRGAEYSSFKAGVNDFSEAAKGGALYCVRMTVMEILLSKEAFWTELFKLYCAGHWPCGIMRDGRLVVF